MRVGAADAVDAKDLAGLAVAAEFLDLKTLVAIGGLQHDGGSAIAEQHGDIAVVPVHVGRDELAARDQRRAHHAAADHRGRCGERIEEARAGGVDVHRGAALGAETLLQAGGRIRALVVISRRADDDEVDVAALEAGAGEGAGAGDMEEVIEGGMGDAPLTDAGAGSDPLVVGLDEGRDIAVRQDIGRKALAPTRDGRIRHMVSLARGLARLFGRTPQDTPLGGPLPRVVSRVSRVR